MLQRWRAAGYTASDSTGPRFQPQTYRSRNKRVTARPTCRLIVYFSEVLNYNFHFFQVLYIFAKIFWCDVLFVYYSSWRLFEQRNEQFCKTKCFVVNRNEIINFVLASSGFRFHYKLLNVFAKHEVGNSTSN